MQNEPTGNLLIEGLTKITTTQQTTNPMSPSEVKDFIRDIGATLLSFVQPAAQVAAAPAARQIAAPAPQAESPKAVSKKTKAPAVVEETSSEVAEEESEEAPQLEIASTPQTIRERFSDLPTEPVIDKNDSIQNAHIICLFDGAKKKMMSRHLKAKYNMTPAEYREYWDLPADYPMTAPGYSAEKRAVAKAQGLGTDAQRKKTGKRTNAKAKTSARRTARAKATA
jgi:predicted transcriptional regulator